MIFFQRKVYLADLLEGTVDIHNHLLPNIDDGAGDIEVTRSMIKAYKNLGFKGVYTTPHTMEDYYGNDVKTITSCFESTKIQLTDHDDFLLGTSSEYMMDAGFRKLLESGNYITLPERHLLFEFSYFQKPFEAEELIFEMVSLGLKPVLAHPERYSYLSVQEIISFQQRGCFLQLNLLSLSGHYGKDAFAKANSLLERNNYAFFGTDAHKTEQISEIQNIETTKRRYKSLAFLMEKHKEIFS